MESLKTILYFSIFKYPLKLEEVCRFYPEKISNKVENELNDLVQKGIIRKVGDYYFSGADADCIEKRKKGNEMAVTAMVKAENRAKLIAKFPFVEAVGVSGSLSKGYYDDKSDIDFFVITTPGKVWVSRTLLMLYKKIFLLNSRKFFCINYFMSASNLEIEEKNRFTATELRTLIPLQGNKAFGELYKKNLWVNDIFGSFVPDLDNVGDIRKPRLTRFVERSLNSSLGNSLDDVFKTVTLKFWSLKFADMDRDDFKIALKSTKDISKHHPLNFQKKVILSLNEKYEELGRQHNITLQKEYV